MAVRTSMAALIDRIRLMIGDTVNATAAPQFSDVDIQGALDRRRMDVRYEVLTPQVTFTSNAYQYLDYYSVYGYWETDVTLLGPSYQPLTPDISELMLDTAHFVFPAGAGNGQYPPVYLAGKTYDIYAAAADLLEVWASNVTRTNYDFTADGATFRRSQIGQGLMAQASQYRAKQRIGMASTGRDDAATGYGSGDHRSALLGPVSGGVRNATGE